MSFHEILGVKPDATPEELRKAWRKLCLKHHPDTGGDPEEFVKITHAYKMLTDPSYVRKNKNQPIKDLTFRVQLQVSFIDAFYGTNIVVNYNQITVNTKLEPIRTDTNLEPIVVSFDLPAGSNDGFVYTEKNKGLKHENEIGKVVVHVRSESHPRYRVNRLDVMTEEKVPLETLLKGGEIVVDTLWGHRTIWVPPGTAPNSKIRVIGCGVDKKGHQYCTIVPIYPDEKELKKDAWSALGINWQKAENKNKEDEELFKKFQEVKNNG